MKADRAVATRWSRVAVLASIVVGWALIAVGLAAGIPSLGLAGAIIAGVGNLVLAKSLLELRTATSSLKASSIQTERAVATAFTDVESLRSMDEELRRADATQDEALDRLRAEATSLEKRFEARVAEIERAHSAYSEAQSQAVAEVRSQVENVTGAHEVTRMGLTATRAIADKLADRSRRALLESPRLLAAAHNDVSSPLLSIAIPSYNRPAALAELLDSIAREVQSCPPGVVELCITDDASSDPDTVETALGFVESHGFASLRVQQSNIGLERNVLAAGEPCRGEFMWLIGNDDRMVAGALRTVLDDIRANQAPVLLYSKDRMRLDGNPSPDVAGSIPIDLPPDGHHVFPTLLAASSRQGLLSTFGFAGPIVLRRAPFVAVDSTRYLDLSMYARTCVLVEAFAPEPVFYRNTAVVVHRTPTQAEKNAEALSRPEEEFMQGGLARRSRYYGTALAASMQRLIDSGAFGYETVAKMPEHLMTDMTLVDWVARNRIIDPGVDERLGLDVVADADRFFEGLQLISDDGEV